MTNKHWKKTFYDSHIRGDGKKMIMILENNAPKTLIKFCNGEFNGDGSNDYLKSLENDEIWLSSPLLFNDPFDCALNTGEEGIEKQIFSFLGDFINDPDFFGKMNETVENNLKLKEDFEHQTRRIKEDFEKLRKVIFIACFSDNKNLRKSLMWSHYANSHKGFCIEYDRDELLKNRENMPFPVFYKKEIKRPLWLYFQSIMNQFEFQLVSAYTKSDEWAYESEWRLLETNDEKSGNKGFNKKFIPAKCVYIGCRASDELRKKIIAICEKKGIEVYQMRMKVNSFDLTYELVSTQ